ncbi:MAG: hypothetical protein ABFR63_04410 [Thermodesulfobacteriota bacterium]
MEKTRTDMQRHEQLSHQHPQMQVQEGVKVDGATAFILEINGVTQCILGNTELLKIRHAHTLNHEAADYLLRIERHTKNLVELLNRFQKSIHPANRAIADKPSATPDEAA